MIEENASIQCLLKLDMDMFCSGGADVCLWHNNGTLLCKITREEKDRKPISKYRSELQAVYFQQPPYIHFYKCMADIFASSLPQTILA